MHCRVFTTKGVFIGLLTDRFAGKMKLMIVISYTLAGIGTLSSLIILTCRISVVHTHC